MPKKPARAKPSHSCRNISGSVRRRQSISETTYFGDNLNDLTAFHEAGVAATVANARSEMQDAADIVERSFSDLGVLKELRHILDLHKRFEAEGKK